MEGGNCYLVKSNDDIIQKLPGDDDEDLKKLLVLLKCQKRVNPE